MHRARLERQIDSIATKRPRELGPVGVEAELRLGDWMDLTVEERRALGLAHEALYDVERDRSSVLRAPETEGPVPFRVTRQEPVRVVPAADRAREVDVAPCDACR